MTRLAGLLPTPPADPRPDGGLIAAFLTDRDEPAFAELVRQHGRFFRRRPCQPSDCPL
jgi:hypothetical protein